MADDILVELQTVIHARQKMRLIEVLSCIHPGPEHELVCRSHDVVAWVLPLIAAGTLCAGICIILQKF